MARGILGLGFLLAILLITSAAVPAQEDKKRAIYTYVQFRDLGNQALSDPFPSQFTEDNSLKDFPRGEQKFEGVPYYIGDKVIHLGSSAVKKFPDKVEGLRVDRKCDKIHILQTTAYGGGKSGTSDGLEIAHYKVNYSDNTEAKIPVEYGKDLRDWFQYMDLEKKLERGTVAWLGENEVSKRFKSKIRVYAVTWTNPNPDKKISTIDFAKTANPSASAPFCFGITVESK